MKTDLMPMNDYVILSDTSEGEGKIEMLNKVPNAVQVGKPVHASENHLEEMAVNLPEGTTVEQIVVYYRAVEGMEIPDEDLVAIPMSAIIAVQAEEQAE